MRLRKEIKRANEGWVSDDSHNLWLNLAYTIMKSTGYDVWVNDMGYMEVSGDGSTWILSIDNTRDKLIVKKDGKTIDRVDVETDRTPRFDKTWFE